MLTIFAESYETHAVHLAEQWERYGAPTRMALLPGLLMSSSGYLIAQKARRLGRKLLAELFTDVDVLVTPTVATAAPRLDDIDLGTLFATMFTALWSGLGLPAC